MSEALGADALTEALAAGFLVDAGPGCLEFRHALVRDAVYHAIPWTRRRSLHTSVARLLEQAGAPAAERATQWLGAGDVERARAALAEAAAASVGRLRLPRRRRRSTNARSISTAARSRCASSCSSVSPSCAELAGDLAASARAWREVIDGRRGRGEVERVAEAEHAIGRVLALRGSTERALAAWFAAADAFAACGRQEDAARSASRRPTCCRSAAASSRRSPGSRRRSPTSRPARRPSCARARARSRGSCSASSGQSEQALAVRARSAVGGALGRPPATAAAAYQALAVVYENAGDLGEAAEAYEVAIDYCASTGVAGDGRRLLGLPLPRPAPARRVAAQPRALPQRCSTIRRSTRQSRAIAAAVMSQIHASRGERRPRACACWRPSR